jgi:hypothetical protein
MLPYGVYPYCNAGRKVLLPFWRSSYSPLSKIIIAAVIILLSMLAFLPSGKMKAQQRFLKMNSPYDIIITLNLKSINIKMINEEGEPLSPTSCEWVLPGHQRRLP